MVTMVLNSKLQQNWDFKHFNPKFPCLYMGKYDGLKPDQLWGTDGMALYCHQDYQIERIIVSTGTLFLSLV